MNSELRYQQITARLNPNELINIAQQQTGLTDFGDTEFLEPFHKLLECVAKDVDFHEQGLEGFRIEMVRCLVNRLRIENDIKLHPEILDENVDDPIIVIGLGRSGTTKLHKMLSAPDSVQKTLFWRLWNPGRFPDAVEGEPDPRIAASDFSQLLTDGNDAADAAHHMEQQEVEEEWILYLLTFEDWGWNQQLHSPSYFKWLMQRPHLEAFRYVKKVLQYLQWQDGGKQGRPWILKTVGYIADMDALLTCYPKATLVHPHRDPHATIPSYSKLLASMWPLLANPLDPKLLGADVQHSWGVAVARYLEARQRLKLDDRIYDVPYEQVRTDPMGVMREIYVRAGLTLTPRAEQKMAAWHESNEQGKYGKHVYSLETFGMNNASIEAAFGDYMQRFITD